ncbi:hypothetical protein PXK56_18465 [Phaeobacter gallaeciensis]|uniref:hypothetical protein n=1 Tax=Phaeobacter gallaeciensis TaxID=60890 RepID=UPI002380BD53|nr:hypothetical protein [Phaeobacter gallaeciensis]MDE4297172.1 hypothetical protein [Phaeobacter gallaeciensis]
MSDPFNTKIEAGMAVLDVTTGRQALAKHFESRPTTGPCPERLRVPVTITGYIDYAWGDDDGTSQGFVTTIEKIERRR